ncbi:MAG TPA: peptide ABC transporter substrate-binding protein [Candidatus Eremiobacteraceae bacterium]|nr:peptide ABC transporter substrate-binding protein [Candidatus Eremiobacteraceae bacterium]
MNGTNVRANLALALAAILLILPACGSHPATSSRFSPGRASPGLLRIASAQVDNLNTVLSGGGSSTYLSFLWGAYLYISDPQGNLEPELATVIPTRQNGGISADALTIVYHLRRGVRWQDGAPFDARDVIFTWHAIMNPKNNVASRLGFDKVAGMQAPDPFTVRVRLKEPYSPAVAGLFAPSEVPLCILPQHLLARYPDINRAPYNSKPVGTGPFTIDRYDPSTGVFLKANPSYWRGVPKLRGINYLFVPDPNTVEVMMRTGELDLAYVTATRAHELAGRPGVTIVHAPANIVWFLSLNVAHAPLDDVRVRRAIAMAVDRRRYLENFQHGIGSLAVADQPPFLWSFDPHVQAPPYDPQQAQRLLDSAGWRMTASGYRERASTHLTLTFAYSTDQADAIRFGPLFQEAMRGIGIDVSIKGYPYNIFYAQRSASGILNSGKYDIAYTGWVGGVDPDDAALWMCDQLPPGGYNWSFLCDPRIDAQERIALRSYDRAVRRQAYWRIQELLAEEVPAVFLAWSDNIYAARSTLRGFYPTSTYSNAWNWQI